MTRQRDKLSAVLPGGGNNQAAGKTYVYEYDSRGNILSRKTYAYSLDSLDNLGTASDTDLYWYDGGAWGDQLINYDSTYRVYDQLGNPTQYEKPVNGTLQTFKFDWQKGRQLTQATIGETVYNYTYDADGIRTSKTVGNTTYKYYTSGGQLQAMTISNGSTVTTTMQFYYNALGTPVAFKYNGTLYYYLTNLQGDVIGILDTNGLCATYTYDAWGRIVDTFSMSNLSETLLNVNPLRYRGYIYDIETGFYYLQSRYYDPEVGRFINADEAEYLGANGDLNSYNLYAYCSNNPVMYSDPSGNIIVSAIVAGAIIGFVIGFSSSIAGQYMASDCDADSIDLREAVYDGIFGAINGALAATGIGIWSSIGLGAALGGISSIGSDLIFNHGEINLGNAVINAALGGVSGLIAGGGADSTIVKYLHSKNIFNSTVANNTLKAIPKQFDIMCNYIGDLFISGAKYVIGNTFATCVSKVVM